MRTVILLKLHLSLKCRLSRRRRIIHHRHVSIQLLLMSESFIMHRRRNNEGELNRQNNHRN